MSYLDSTRIHFRGSFVTNPNTANNDDVIDGVDGEAVKLKSPLTQMPDDTAIAWFKELTIKDGNTGADGAPRPTNFLKSGWNYFGDHSTRFDQVVVTSFGEPAMAPNFEGSPVGWPVTIVGSNNIGVPTTPTTDLKRRYPVIVDVDCTGLVTTQLWIGGFDIGGVLSADADVRAYQRRLSFNRTLGPYAGEQNFVNFGCMFQFSVPKNKVSLVEGRSPYLDYFYKQALMANPRALGICVRFSVFQCQPDKTGMQMFQEYEAGGGSENPATAYVIGTVGIQYKDQWGVPEQDTVSAGRYLVAPLAPPVQNVAWQSYQRRNPADQTNLGAMFMGSATATFFTKAGNPWLAVDLLNSLPQDAFRYPQPISTFAPAKANIGKLAIGYIPTGGSPVVVGQIPYGINTTGTASYDYFSRVGEIYDVPLTPDQANNMLKFPLVLLATNDSPLNAGMKFLTEDPVRITTDDRGVYMPLDTQLKQPISLLVRELGQPPKTDVNINIYENHDVIVLQGVSQRPNQTIAPATPDDMRLSFPASIRVPAGQTTPYTFNVTPIRPGAASLVFRNAATTPGNIGPLGPSWGYAYFANLKIYPNDDYSKVPDPVPWEVVYQEVLRYYYILFPAMSLYIPLNSPDGLRNVLPQLLARIDNANFSSTHFMPITREMSPGKRALLQRWIKQQKPNVAATRPAAATPAT